MEGEGLGESRPFRGILAPLREALSWNHSEDASPSVTISLSMDPP